MAGRRQEEENSERASFKRRIHGLDLTIVDVFDFGKDVDYQIGIEFGFALMGAYSGYSEAPLRELDASNQSGEWVKKALAVARGHFLEASTRLALIEDRQIRRAEELAEEGKIEALSVVLEKLPDNEFTRLIKFRALFYQAEAFLRVRNEIEESIRSAAEGQESIREVWNSERSRIFVPLISPRDYLEERVKDYLIAMAESILPDIFPQLSSLNEEILGAH